MKKQHIHLALVLLIATAFAGSTHAAEDGEQTLDSLIRDYLAGRGAEVKLAPASQLARRYALDFTGVIPSIDDLNATESMTPGEMFDYFKSRGPMTHTGGATAYAWRQLLGDADHFLFSNSTQFSQVAHIREFRDQLSRIYTEGWSYQEFARWALTSQMFLNRFPSGADRANAAFFLLLGRDSFSSEVQAGNMWNGYVLRDASIPASRAETDPDYHVYDFDQARCGSGDVVCQAELWSQTGSTPREIVELLVTSSLFAEATVDRYWQRLLGQPLPGVEFPAVRAVLAKGFVASGYDVNWLIREIATSAAYTQEMMFR